MNSNLNEDAVKNFLDDSLILLSKLAIDKDNAKLRLLRNGVEMLSLLNRLNIPKEYVRANELKSSIVKKLTKNKALYIENIIYSNQIFESLQMVHLKTCSKIIKDFYDLYCDIRDSSYSQS